MAQEPLAAEALSAGAEQGRGRTAGGWICLRSRDECTRRAVSDGTRVGGT